MYCFILGRKIIFLRKRSNFSSKQNENSRVLRDIIKATTTEKACAVKEKQMNYKIMRICAVVDNTYNSRNEIQMRKDPGNAQYRSFRS